MTTIKNVAVVGVREKKNDLLHSYPFTHLVAEALTLLIRRLGRSAAQSLIDF